jgi:2-polyprenyl-3-methyl-5-hydroxy-6-metoxy-1,4-benzoquinol methylase
MREHLLTAEPYQLKDFKDNSHYWILHSLSQAQKPLRILDVGTANGYLGAILKKRGHWQGGVEREDTAAEQAEGYYDVFHHTDIEEFDFPYRHEFDYLLFADVLEYLRDPAAVIRRSLPCLKKNGQIIVSVPNIANFVIRTNLLVGRFE